MAKERIIKEPIRIRQKQLANGNISLYLDIYFQRARRYEFLRLYLIPEKNRDDKERNRQTMMLANSIKSKRMMEIQSGEYGFKNQFKTNTLFFDYYRVMCQKRLGTESRGNWGNWYSCLHHLRKYERNERITFEKITPEWVQGFKDYLEDEAVAWGHDTRKRAKDKPLARNSKLSYFNKLRACLNQAFEDGIIPTNPCKGIEGFRAEESTRMYLTIDEIKKLAQTDCDYPRIKDAFLFSCLTGLRRSDVIRLKWGDIHKQGDFTRIIFRQKKTQGQEYLDISSQAAALMGDMGHPESQIFDGVLTPSATNKVIQEWVLRAGIPKKITFHCARHSFATMMIDLGTDIYTVSKLLGHREIATTQIYAKILDKNKQRAVMNIPQVL